MWTFLDTLMYKELVLLLISLNDTKSFFRGHYFPHPSNMTLYFGFIYDWFEIDGDSWILSTDPSCHIIFSTDTKVSVPNQKTWSAISSCILMGELHKFWEHGPRTSRTEHIYSVMALCVQLHCCKAIGQVRA